MTHLLIDGAGSSTEATEETPSMARDPSEVSIRYVHAMVYTFKRPWSCLSRGTSLSLTEFVGGQQSFGRA